MNTLKCWDGIAGCVKNLTVVLFLISIMMPVSGQAAASMFWGLIVVMTAAIVFVYSGNTIAGLLLSSPMLILGAYLGLITIYWSPGDEAQNRNEVLAFAVFLLGLLAISAWYVNHWWAANA